MTGMSSVQPVAAAPYIITDHTVIPAISVREAILSSDQLLALIRRLIVLVPDADVDQARLAHAVWSLAYEPGLDVLLLGLVRDISREPRARVRLATLAAMIRDNRTHVDTQISVGTSWEVLVQSFWQAGDLLVCHAEQSKSAFGIRREPLAPALASILKIPVYVLDGLYQELPPDSPNWISPFLTYLPSLAIIAGFFVIQVGIQRLVSDWRQTALLVLSVMAEFGLIWAWESHLMGQSLR